MYKNFPRFTFDSKGVVWAFLATLEVHATNECVLSHILIWVKHKIDAIVSWDLSFSVRGGGGGAQITDFVVEALPTRGPSPLEDLSK